MEVKNFSTIFNVRKLDTEDKNIIYELLITNPLYYEYFPPMANLDSIDSDMKALPPNKEYKDKYYVGYFSNDKLVGVLDLILKYPNEETAYIGLFITNQLFQGQGMGSEIMKELSVYLKNLRFKKISLAYAKGNPQAEKFWLKNGFIKTGKEIPMDNYTAILMDKNLD